MCGSFARMRRSTLLLIALALATLGCSDTSKSPSGPGGGTGGASDDDGGMAMFVVWPAHWDKVPAQLDALAGKLPEEAREEVSEVAAMVRRDLASPEAVIAVAAKQLLRVQLPEKLPGFDARQPIVISAFAPLGTIDEAAVSIAGFITKQTPIAPIAVRHRVVLPASDPAALLAAIEAGLADSSLDKIADPDAPPTYGNEDVVVRFVRGPKAVSMTVAQGVGLTTLDPAGRDRVLGGRAVWTPALRGPLADPSASVARAHLRFDRFAQTGPLTGMIMIARVVADVNESMVVEMTKQGFAEVLSGELLMDPSAAVVSEAFADLPATTAFAPTLYLRLTPAGLAAMRRDAALAAGKPIGVASIDLRAAAAEAPIAAIAEQAKLRDVATLMHECGPSCAVYLGLGNGLRLLSLAGGDDIKETLAAVPQLQLTRLTLSGSVLSVDPFEASNTAFGAAVRKLAPASAPNSSAEHKCHAESRIALRAALRVGAFDDDRTPQLLAMYETEQRANLDCAARDAALAPRVAKVRELVTMLRETTATPPSP